MFEQIINVDRMEQAVSLFGSFDENIRQIEREFSVSVVSRGRSLKSRARSRRMCRRACAPSTGC